MGTYTQAKHRAAAAEIIAQVKHYFDAKKPFHIYHGSTNSTRILTFKRSEMIDVSQLNHVLSVDKDKRTVLVEPNVPMDKLVQETLRYGLLPEVVMEFPGITVGGGIQGGAGESSSFRYGCFNETCESYEMILANGDIVNVSRDEHADLFYGTAGSFGTLGIITAATVRLVPAKKYVNLTYLPIKSFEAACALLQTTVKEPHDYIDGIMFGADHGVIIVGSLSDSPSDKVRRFTRAHDDWYYLHAEKIDAVREEISESVPLVDYLFRYDRGGFWVGRYAFEIFGLPFKRFTRWLLNPYFHTRRLYNALQTSGASQQYIVQDLTLPLSKAVEFMQFVDIDLQIHPLWLCPLRPDMKSPLQSNNLRTPLVINIGVWGNAGGPGEEFIAASRQIESRLARLGGKKWFYAHSYYTEAEFWINYDRAWYDALRKKYHAEHLPTVFDKIRVKETHPIEIKRGALRTLFGMAKLRIKD